MVLRLLCLVFFGPAFPAFRTYRMRQQVNTPSTPVQFFPREPLLGLSLSREVVGKCVHNVDDRSKPTYPPNHKTLLMSSLGQ